MKSKGAKLEVKKFDGVRYHKSGNALSQFGRVVDVNERPAAVKIQAVHTKRKRRQWMPAYCVDEVQRHDVPGTEFCP